MEVRHTLLLTLLALSFIGCGEKRAAEGIYYSPSALNCSAAQMVEKKFIAYWKDGNQTEFIAEDKSEVLSKFIPENLESLEMVEQDQYLATPQVPAPILSTVNSAYASKNWGVHRIQAPVLWSKGFKGQNVIVAVIDSGIDITHPQLKSRLYVNLKEIPGDGIDNDGNGLVDDVSGYDFARLQPLKGDYVGHGTHVSGIIGADPRFGDIEGVAPEAKILPLAFMEAKGKGTVSRAIQAMQYAADQGASVVNASWGGSPCSYGMQKAVEDLGKRGVLFVVASGNESIDLDLLPQFPANLTLENQITVGAHGYYDYEAAFSNYSKTYVQLVAPGINIWSTYPVILERPADGTSMAAPFVSGAAALLKSFRPQANPKQIRDALLGSVVPGDYRVQTGGRLDVLRAMDRLQQILNQE